MFSSRTVLLASTALLALSLPSDAFAQFKSQVNKSPVIVVTPTKNETNIDEVPYSVTVVDQHEIEKTQPTSIDDILRYVPNVDAAGGPRSVAEEPSMRGLSDRRIVIKVDGIRRNFRAQYGGRYFLDPYMIDRVEVVRGANSAVDGSGAMAGVLQFFTPTVERNLAGSSKSWGSSGAIGFQSGNTEISTMMSAYTRADKADIYAAGSYRNSDNVNPGGHYGDVVPSGAEPRNGLVKVGYNFSPTHRAEVRYGRFYDRSDIAANPFQPADPLLGNFPSRRESGVSDMSAHYKFSPQNSYRDLINLNSIVYRSEYTINTIRNFDNRLDETDFNTNGMDTYNTAKLGYFGMNHKLTTGVEYYDNEQKGRRNGAPRPLLGDGKDSNLGLYVQQETAINDRLKITPGIRLDHYELEPGNPVNPSQNRNQWSPKIGADYKINDNWSTYGSVSKSFRTPTLTELYATGTLFPGNTLISNPNLNPETGINKEIGVRYKKDGVFGQYDNIKLNVSVFQNDIDDYIEQVVTPATTQFRNVSQARLRGIEVEARYRTGPYAAMFSAGTVRGENETLNEPLTDVPQNKFTGGVEYYAYENTWMNGVRANYNQEQDRIPTGQPAIVTTGGSVTFDVYGTYAPIQANNDQGFSINYGVDNIFDKGYRRQLAFLPEMGRNAKVTLNWKF